MDPRRWAQDILHRIRTRLLAVQRAARRDDGMKKGKRGRRFYARRNGALLLQKRILYPAAAGKDNPIRIFSEEEITKATNNCDHRLCILECGLGFKYFKGIIDGREITVKSSIKCNPNNIYLIEKIMTEIVILSRINHKHLAKLLGCCLETEVPVLVYEPLSNGSLKDHLSGRGNQNRTFAWSDRLRIAAETAEALNYLNTHSSMTIVHRDVKPSCIMLDEHLTAKISGFDLLFPITADNKLSYRIQGYLGYMAPEYLEYGKLSEKTDVFSFGGVMFEFLTGENPNDFVKSTGKEYTYEILAELSSDKLMGILDSRIVQGGRLEQIRAFAQLVIKCFRDIADRPTMKEVVLEIWRIRRL